MLTFTPIDRIWYFNITASSIAFLVLQIRLQRQISELMSVSLITRLLMFIPPLKESLCLTFLLPYHFHDLRQQKCSGIIYQLQVLEICHQSLTVNMSTGFQNISSAPLSYTPYIWSGIQYLWRTLVLDISSYTQTPSLLTLGVLPQGPQKTFWEMVQHTSDQIFLPQSTIIKIQLYDETLCDPSHPGMVFF